MSLIGVDSAKSIGRRFSVYELDNMYGHDHIQDMLIDELKKSYAFLDSAEYIFKNKSDCSEKIDMWLSIYGNYKNGDKK